MNKEEIPNDLLNREVVIIKKNGKSLMGIITNVSETILRVETNSGTRIGIISLDDISTIVTSGSEGYHDSQ